MRNKWTEKEIEILYENYHKGVEYVSILLLNHTKNSISKKANELDLIVDINNLYYDIDIVKEIVKNSLSFVDVLRKLNKSISGDSYKVIKKFINRNKIDTSHFKFNKNNKFKEISLLSYMVNGSTISSSKLKDKLYKYNLKQRICEKCGQTEIWNDEKISLILDHINGVNNDNRIENLRILCPNCNATLETHCGKNKSKRNVKLKENGYIIGEKIDLRKNPTNERINSYYFRKRKVQRPSYKKLLSEISEFGYVKTGKLYGVSDNSIRKWIKMYEKYGENF